MRGGEPRIRPGAALGHPARRRVRLLLSLTIHSLREAGFDTGDATYTGNLSENLTKRGWKRLPADISTCRPGDILLNDTHHVCVVVEGHGWDAKVAQASIDERGRASGGQSGDQTGYETNVRGVYEYSHGWDCILRWAGADDDTPSIVGVLDVDGWIGPLSVAEWQRQCGTPTDCVVSGQGKMYAQFFPNLTSVSFEADGSALMKAVQVVVGVPNPTGIIAQGTICLLQGWLVLRGYGIGDDRAGVLGAGTAKAIQRSLNDGMWS